MFSNISLYSSRAASYNSCSRSDNFIFSGEPSNKIEDISVFEKVKFTQLQKLNLGSNSIKNISVLERVHFDKLQELHLYKNQIADIGLLKRVKFNKLQELYLNDNNIDKKKFEETINELKTKINNFFI